MTRANELIEQVMLGEDPIRVINESKQYKYGALLRPIGFATVPKGYVAVESHSAFKHGVVVYAKPLSKSDTNHLDLVPLVPWKEIVDSVVSEFKEYAETYVEDYADDMREFEVMVGQAYDRLKVHPDKGKFDRSKLAREVMVHLKRIAR